jgi:hypothetical protein
MLADIPALALLAFAAAIVLLPAASIAYLFGGRGLVVALVGLALTSAYLIAGVLYGRPSDNSTGMEGIVIVVAPLFWIGAAICSGLVFLGMRALGWLPRQRRARSEKP